MNGHTGLAAQESARLNALATVAKLRHSASAEIERLIAFLDQTDSYVTTELELDDSDDELTGDEEPSLCGVSAKAFYFYGAEIDVECDLGWSDPIVEPGETMCLRQRWKATTFDQMRGRGGASDLEDETEHDEDNHDAEPDEQDCDLAGATSDLEEDHDGREPDEDAEPSLGWPDGRIAQGPGSVGDSQDCEIAANPRVTDGDRAAFFRSRQGNVRAIPGAEWTVR